MSAYGAVTVTNGPIDLLPPTTWDLPQPAPGKPAATAFRRLVLHHLRLESTRVFPSLLEYTHRIFAAEVEAGRTYPQEADALAAAAAAGGSLSCESDDDTHTRAAPQAAYTRAAFEAYFWAADVIVAIGQTDDDAADHGGGDDGRVQAQALNVGSRGDLSQLQLEISRGGRRWEDAIVGFYYVKPNYPGRSSHVSECVSFLSNDPFLPLLFFNIYFYARRSLGHTLARRWVGLGRFAMRVLLSRLPTENSDMERLWAGRTCIMVLRSDTKQAFSIWSMQIIQGV
jgi:hypothetical protein